MTQHTPYNSLDGSVDNSSNHYYSSNYSNHQPKNTFQPLISNFLDFIAKLLRNKFIAGGVLLLILSSLILMFVGPNLLAFVFVILSIVSFLVTMAMPFVGTEFGLSAMLILSTIQGWEMGFIVGKLGNLIGQIVTFQLDIDFLYDLTFLPLAIVASFFSLAMLPWVGVVLILVYTAGYFVYLKSVGAIDGEFIMYGITNCIFNIIVIWKLVPILVSLGLG